MDIVHTSLTIIENVIWCWGIAWKGAFIENIICWRSIIGKVLLIFTLSVPYLCLRKATSINKQCPYIPP